MPNRCCPNNFTGLQFENCRREFITNMSETEAEVRISSSNEIKDLDKEATYLPDGDNASESSATDEDEGDNEVYNFDVLRLLLEQGVCPNEPDKNNCTPLHHAARSNALYNGRTLFEFGAEPSVRSKDGITPLHEAAQEGHVEMVRLLIENEAEVNATAVNGFTPLHICAKEDKVVVAAVLVKNGADINLEEDGSTPLQVARNYEQLNMERFLLPFVEGSTSENRLLPHTADDDGDTALHVAAKDNNIGYAAFLLENGADPDIKNEDEFTALHLAAKSGHADMAAVLLEYGADVNSTAENGFTPFHVCAQEGTVSVANVLVRYGAGFLRDDSGKTPVHIAAMCGETNMCEFILQFARKTSPTESHEES